METYTQKPLEDRAKALLIWKLTKRGKAPNPFSETRKIAEELQFLTDRGYIVQSGGTPKSLDYEVTPKGRAYALSRRCPEKPL